MSYRYRRIISACFLIVAIAFRKTSIQKSLTRRSVNFNIQDFENKTFVDVALENVYLKMDRENDYRFRQYSKELTGSIRQIDLASYVQRINCTLMLSIIFPDTLISRLDTLSNTFERKLDKQETAMFELKGLFQFIYFLLSFSNHP